MVACVEGLVLVLEGLRFWFGSLVVKKLWLIDDGFFVVRWVECLLDI
jgi:hypothetical protein